MKIDNVKLNREYLSCFILILFYTWKVNFDIIWCIFVPRACKDFTNLKRFLHQKIVSGSPRGVEANILDYNFLVSEFKLSLCY